MYHDHAYFALRARRDADHTHFLGRPAVRCAANRHTHGAVPDLHNRLQKVNGHVRSDICQDFKISGKISRFRARFQDFRQDFNDFKISGKISIETYEISRVSDPSI